MTGPRPDNDDAEFEAWKKKRAKITAPTDTATDDDAEYAAWKAARSPKDTSTVFLGSSPSPTPTTPPTPTPAPRRTGIAGALGSLVDEAGDWWKNRPSRQYGGGFTGGEGVEGKANQSIYDRTRENRTIERPPSVEMQSTADYARTARARPVVPRLPLTQRPDVTDAAGIARTRGPSPTEPTQTVAEDRQRRLTATQNQQGTEHANFSPERLKEIAAAGMKRAAELRAEGKTVDADEYERMSRNTQLAAENAGEADTFGAIALSNLLGIVSDPYAQQRKNIAEAAAPGALFSPEQTEKLIGERVAPSRSFDVSKDLAAPLVGQLPVFVASGAAGRVLTGAAGAFAEARGARSIGQALTRLSQLGEDAEVAGPRVPVRSIPLAQARIAEEVSQFRNAVPAMMARGVSEGQAVGAVMTYKQAREQGASVEDALGAAAEGVPMNILMGTAGELLISGAGKALGLGFDPVGRVIRDIKEGRGLEGTREIARPMDRRGEVQQREVGAQRANVASALDQILNEKIRTSRGESERPLGPEAPPPPMVEGVETYRTRGTEPNTPLRSARDVALERAGAEPERPIDQFNAVKRMEHEREALRQQAEAEANDPNLRLERAAQEAPGRVQGPRTLRETLADVGPAAEQGDELAAGYTKAINDYVDALANVQDAGEKGPNTKTAIKLARARQALNDARKKYGAQLGASAVLALAANNDDLSDEEKAAVGLAAVPLALRSVREHLGVPRERIAAIRDAVVGPEVTDHYGKGVQPWMDDIRRHFPADESAAPALEKIEQALYDKVSQKGTNGTLTPSEVREVLTPPEHGTEREPLYSRLRAAIEDRQQFPKKWDEPRPAADWIGKLKGSNTFSKKELELILPILEHAQASKAKIDRATMAALVEDHVPRIERTTLADTRGSRSAEAGDGNAEDIVSLDDLRNTPHSAEELQAQINNRRERISEIESGIEERQNEAREEMDAADQEARVYLDSIEETLRKNHISRNAMDDAIDYIRDRVEGEYVPRGVVDKAWSKVWEDIVSELDSGNDYESLLKAEDYTISDEPSWRVEVRGSEGVSRRYTLSAEDLGFSVEEIERGITEEQVKAKLDERYGDDLMEYEPWDDVYTVRDRNGGLLAESDDRDTVMRDVATDEGLGANHEEVLSDLKSDLERYADELANYLAKESEHYYYSENDSEAFSGEYAEKEMHESEIGEIEDLIAQAREREAAGVEHPALAAGDENVTADPDDPEAHLLEPVSPRVKGSVKYASYQRIGGGSNYRELLNQWEGKPGEPYSRNHYGGQGFPNVISHVRAEDHVVPQYPGVTGEKIEISGSDPQPVRDVKSKIVELRKQRDKLLTEMQGLVNQHEAMPPAERENAAAHRLAQQYGELNQRVIDVGKEEDKQLAKLGAMTNSGATAKKVAVMVESQSDWAQDASKYGVQRAPLTDAEQRVLKQRVADLTLEHQRNMAELNTARDERREALVRYQAALGQHPELYDEFATAMRNRRIDDRQSGFNTDDLGQMWSAHILLDDVYSVERDWLLHHPVTGPHLDAYLTYVDEVARLEERQHQTYEALNTARDELAGGPSNAVPASPFIDTQAAFTLNAARFLLDAAERGHTDIAWSDAANRMKNAHLPFAAAKLVYDEITPSAMTKLLGFLGFKNVKPDKLYIRGEGHWHIELTPEMRKAIRKYGLPILGVLALPATAKAQGEGGSRTFDPYASVVGGVAIGAALMYAAQHRAARRLLHENRELARVVEMDELSGLANKRAFARAKANIDADENFGVVAMDGDGFGQINKKLGHAAGDKAIQHFGEVLRQAADELEIPLRAFRVGGDEFVYAVPKERMADLAAYIEQHSEYTDGDVKTRLTAGMGETYEEADASLIARKAERKAAQSAIGRYVDSPMYKAARATELSMVQSETPNLDYVLGEVEKEVGKTQAEELARRGFGGLDGQTFHANPVGLALEAIRRSPKPASIAALGVILAQSDDEDLKKTSPYMIGLAALSAIGSGPLIAGKDALVKRTVEMMRQIGGENVVRFFNPDALLDPSVKDAIAQFERERARAVARAREFSAKSKALGPEGDRAVSDVLEGEGWEDTSGFTPELMNNVLAVASALEAEYSQTAAAQVATGARTPDQLVEPYAGPRRYAAIEAEAVQRDKPGYVPSRATRIGELKRRTLDIPIREAEQALAEAQASGDPAAIQAAQDRVDEARVVQMSRRTELGEIREQSYRAAQGIEAGYANAAAAKLFSTLKNVPGVVHPEFVRLTDELKTAKQMLATATTQADRDAATQLVQSATFELDKLKKEFQRKDGAYVSLSDSKGLGDLRGAIVKRDVAHSITGFSDNTAYKKLLRQWKELKTVFNIGTHIANVVSNFTFAHMEGLLLHQQPVYLKRALADMKKYGDATRALAEGGLLDHNAVTADGSSLAGRDLRSVEGLDELRKTTRPETRTVLEDHGLTAQAERTRNRRSRLKGAAIGGAVGAAALASDDHPEDAALGGAIGAGVGALVAGRGRGVRKLYNNEDNIFRVAIYLKKLDDGMSKDDALRYTQASLGNFRTRSPALNLVRTTLSPFILYPAKAVPRFARQMIDHPWRYVALMSAWAALNEYAEQDEGAIPDSDLPIKDRTQSKWGYFFPGFTQLPTQDEQGNKGATDISRWTPMSGVTTGTPPGTVTGTINEKLPAVLQPSGPLLDAAAKLYGNVDPTTGRPRIKPDYPAGENIATLLNDASELGLPPALGFHRKRLQEDVENRDPAKFKTDILGPTGLRPRFVRPGANIASALHQLETSLSDMKFEFERDVRNNKDSRPERTQSLVDRYLRRRKSAISNFIERTGSTPPADVVPPPEME